MKLILRGTHFALSGSPEHASQQTFDRLRAQGGVLGQFSGKTDVLVCCGARHARRVRVAEARGVVVIDESQFLRLVEVGSLEVEHLLDKDPGMFEFDLLLGEVRGWISGEKKREVWERVVEVVDECLEEQREPLVDYIDGFISQWSWEEQRLCEAPNSWVVQMVNEVESCKFKLIRRIDFKGQDYMGGMVLKVLKQPHLVNLRSLKLDLYHRPMKTLFRQLHLLPSCQHLRELGVESLLREHWEELRQGEGLQKLEAFEWCMSRRGARFNDSQWSDAEHVISMLRLPCLASIRSLKLSHSSWEAIFGEEEPFGLGHLERLEHLDLRDVGLGRGLRPRHVVILSMLGLRRIDIGLPLSLENPEPCLSALNHLPAVRDLRLNLIMMSRPRFPRKSLVDRVLESRWMPKQVRQTEFSALERGLSKVELPEGLMRLELSTSLPAAQFQPLLRRYPDLEVVWVS